ncbi:FtsX-like permease family protein [bacterium BMS3Abin09]|nr:FtsX-like permease family protein [bacterium BMS3Abin09]
MKILDRKILRNLWGMKGQAVAIALVIACGVATFIMSISTMHSLKLTQATFYTEYRFAEVFSSLKRAPETLSTRIREIPGVDRVETRVVAPVSINITDFPDPVKGHFYSIPDNGEPLLNKLYLRKGRMPEPFREGEIVVGEAFAEAHNFSPGNEIGVVINGKRKDLTIVGIALSPEHIYQMPPGAFFPDFERYGIIWMGRGALATAYDMKGAFNNVTIGLSPGARTDDVIDRLDILLKPYGGLGAYGRKDQLSHRYLSEEFRGLEQMASIFPVIFLGVAAFLLNVVISRLVSIQREEVAALKAFGYSNFDIGLHFVKLILLIVLVGVTGGIIGGFWLGKWMSTIYMEFYRFPFLKFELQPWVAVIAAFVSAAAAVLGTLHSIRKTALLPPAQAMQPEPPPVYKETTIERLGLKDLLSQPSRMIIRHIGRSPVKSMLSITGIALACAIMMVGSFQKDALDYIVDIQFGLSQREDISVTFIEPTSRSALHELQSIEGVKYGEPFRAVPARLRFRHRSYRTAVQGIEPGGDLQRVLDTNLKPVNLPSSGIVLTDYLGKMLGVSVGDKLIVEVLEGRRPVLEVPVVAFINQYIGVSAYMNLSALNRLMREGNAISGVYLAADPLYHPGIFKKLKEAPRVAGTEVREKSISKFYETMGETMLIFTFINTLLAGIIAFGVVYNSARIALSERSRELASLRVLGFTRGEISYILLGELSVLTIAAVPLGFIIGRVMCGYIAEGLKTDIIRVPLILEPNTYAFAALVVLISACISSLIIRRRLDHLDLIAVLKTKE